jgi:hypothetical protein
MVLLLLLFNISTTKLTSTNRCFQISTIITIAVCIAISYSLALASISCAVGVHGSVEPCTPATQLVDASAKP